MDLTLLDCLNLNELLNGFVSTSVPSEPFFFVVLGNEELKK